MRAVTVAMLIAGLLAAGTALAQTREWDQKAVSAKVDEFVAVLGKIQLEARTTDNVKSEAAREFVIEDLDMLRKNARKLQQELREGKDRTASSPRAKRVASLISRTRTNAKEAMLEPSDSEAIERANELIAEVGAFYTDNPDVGAPRSQQ